MMSTINFHNVNASKVYAVEIKDDWGLQDLKYNLSTDLDMLHQAGVQDPDESRSYPSHVMGYLEAYECFRIGCDDLELYIRIFPTIRGGYYSGVNLDYFVEVRDVFDVMMTKPGNLLNFLSSHNDVTPDEREAVIDMIKEWIEETTYKLETKVEKVFADYSTPLNLVGVASNGEGFYEAA